MANKYYGIRDNWTDDDLSNVVDITSEDGVITEVNVNGEPFGGGGGGDVVFLHPYFEEVEEVFYVVLDKTWNELKALFDAEKDILIISKNTEEPYPNITDMKYMSAYSDRFVYSVTFRNPSGEQDLYNSSTDANGYPRMEI